MVTPMCSQLTYEGVIDEVMLPSDNIFFCIDRSFHVTSSVPRNLQYIAPKPSAFSLSYLNDWSSWNNCAFHLLWLLCPFLDIFNWNWRIYFGVNVYFKSCIWLQFIQINNGAVELEPSVMGAQPNSQASARKVKVPLNSRYRWRSFVQFFVKPLACALLRQSERYLFDIN